MFYILNMPDSLPLQVTETVIAAAILQSPAVTRLGLACPSDRLRERAAADLAQEIVAKLITDASQLKLSL
jgi:hypothetical protein